MCESEKQRSCAAIVQQFLNAPPALPNFYQVLRTLSAALEALAMLGDVECPEIMQACNTLMAEKGNHTDVGQSDNNVLISDHPEYRMLQDMGDVERDKYSLVIGVVCFCCYQRRLSAQSESDLGSAIDEACRNLRLKLRSNVAAKLPQSAATIPEFSAAMSSLKDDFPGIERLVRYYIQRKSAISRGTVEKRRQIAIDPCEHSADRDDEYLTHNSTRIYSFLGVSTEDANSLRRSGHHPAEFIIDRVDVHNYEIPTTARAQKYRARSASAAINQRNVHSTLRYAHLVDFELRTLGQYIWVDKERRYNTGALAAWEFECVTALILYTGHKLDKVCAIKWYEAMSDVRLKRGELAYLPAKQGQKAKLGIRLFTPEWSSALTVIEEQFLSDEFGGDENDKRPVLWAPLPPSLDKLLTLLMKSHRLRGNTAGRLFSRSKSDYSREVKKQLAQINQKYGTTLTLARLEKHLADCIFDVTHDHAFAYMLMGYDIAGAAVSAHYLYAKISRVEEVFICASGVIDNASGAREKSVFQSPLLLEKQKDVGSRLNLKETHLKELVAHLKTMIGRAVREGDAISAHNYMVCYLNCWLGFTTGHRPVNAPLDDLDLLDMRSGLMAVSDKDNIHKSHSRLVWLTPLFRKQLYSYGAHLDELNRRKVLAYSVDDAITQCGRLFLINRLGKPAVLTPSGQKEVISAWPLKANVNRHWLRSLLAMSDKFASFSDYFMGHWLPGNEPHNKFATTSPRSFVDGMDKFIERIEKEVIFTNQRGLG